MSSESQEVRIALAGFGTVGSAFASLLREEGPRFQRELGVEPRIAVLLDRSHRKKDLASLGPAVEITDSAERFTWHDCDVVVELLGGESPADGILREGLRSGKAVVTANKMLVARHGREYFALARKAGAYFGCEASVAGGIPILRALRRSLFADRIERIRGILNGTSNFILSEMAERGEDFAAALARAQELGYAEADPRLDVSGGDTADKIAILAAFGLGRWRSPETIPTRGIEEIQSIDFLYARHLDASIRLVGVAEREGESCRQRVGPFLVDEHLPLAKVTGAQNAVEVTGARLGPVLLTGAGAGGAPTAVSVASDVVNASLWKRGRGTLFTPLASADGVEDAGGTEENESYPFYLRFTVEDRPGIIASIAQVLAEHRVNVDAVLQEPWSERHRLPFVMTVDSAPYSAMSAAASEIEKLDFHTSPLLILPILRA